MRFGLSLRRPTLSPPSSGGSKRGIHTGPSLSPADRLSIRKGLADSPTFRQLDQGITEQETMPQWKRALRLEARAKGPAPNFYLHPDFTATNIFSTMQRYAAQRKRLATVHLGIRNFVELDNPAHIEIASAAREHLPKLAHEMRHTLDLRKRYGVRGPVRLDIEEEIQLEHQAFETQLQVAKELGVESGLPDGMTPLQAAESYRYKSIERRKKW